MQLSLLFLFHKLFPIIDKSSANEWKKIYLILSDVTMKWNKTNIFNAATLMQAER